MLCFALLTRCRVIRPHVEDQLPHELHEQVTLIQGPLRMEKKCDNGYSNQVKRAGVELASRWDQIDLASPKTRAAQNTDITRLLTNCMQIKECLSSAQF